MTFPACPRRCDTAWLAQVRCRRCCCKSLRRLLRRRRCWLLLRCLVRVSAHCFGVPNFSADIVCFVFVKTLRPHMICSATALALAACEGSRLRYPRIRCPSPGLLLLVLVLVRVRILLLWIPIRRIVLQQPLRLFHKSCCPYPCIPWWHYMKYKRLELSQTPL